MKPLLLAGLLAVLSGEISVFALPGQIDATYANLNLQAGPSSLLALPDGRVVAGFNNQSPVFNGANVGAVLQLNPDGTLDFRVTVSGLNEISWWILGYGDQAEVIEPPKLRSLVAGRAKRMAAMYET